MSRVLLIADLEGIPTVDRAEALVAGGPGHAAALEAMAASVREVVERLRREGVAEVRISDAHRSGGGPNLEAAAFPGCELHFTDDLYGGALLDGVDAVCAVGMHARARSRGFAGHTVSLHTDWQLGGVALDESRLAQLLAAERGIPMWFTCGDDVLAVDCDGVLPCAITKRSSSTTTTRTLDASARVAELDEVFARRNTRLPPVPRAPLTITFQRRVEAEAAWAAGAPRCGPTSIELAPGESFFEQYTQALRWISTTEDAVLAQLTALPGTEAFAHQLAALFAAPWES
jgi:D-amino peptidase